MTKLQANNPVEQAEAETTAEVMQESANDPAAIAQTALNVLIQAVEFAQSKGVFSFEDSHHIYTALKVFRTK